MEELFMQGISVLTVMFVVWGVITAAFVVLMIYRTLVSMEEEDQLFIDPAESKMEEAQREVIERLNRITPFAKVCGWASGLLLLSIAAVWVYQGLTAANSPF
jgi:hypothetical protein